MKVVNPKSLEVVTAKLEPALSAAKVGDRLQFERLGYFTLDAKDSNVGSSLADGPRLVFNRAISLKDTWAK